MPPISLELKECTSISTTTPIPSSHAHSGTSRGGTQNRSTSSSVGTLYRKKIKRNVVTLEWTEKNVMSSNPVDPNINSKIVNIAKLKDKGNVQAECSHTTKKSNKKSMAMTMLDEGKEAGASRDHHNDNPSENANNDDKGNDIIMTMAW